MPSSQLWRALSVFLLLAATLPASADRLELRDGRVLSGHYMGGNRKLMQFVDELGELHKIGVADIRSLKFAEGATQEEVTIVPTLPTEVLPAGTLITVRLTQPIDIDDTRSGQLFKGVTEFVLSSSGRDLVPVGTHVLGRISEQWRRMGGTSTSIIGLKLTSLSLGGKRYGISSEAIPLGGSVPLHSTIEFRLRGPLSLQVAAQD